MSHKASHMVARWLGLQRSRRCEAVIEAAIATRKPKKQKNKKKGGVWHCVLTPADDVLALGPGNGPVVVLLGAARLGREKGVARAWREVKIVEEGRKEAEVAKVHAEAHLEIGRINVA